MDLVTEKRYYKKSLFLSSSVLMVGILLKILHLPMANLTLGLAIFMSLGYVLIGLFQVLRSTYWTIFEKFFWTCGLLCLPLVTDFVYYHIVVKTDGKI